MENVEKRRRHRRQQWPASHPWKPPGQNLDSDPLRQLFSTKSPLFFVVVKYHEECVKKIEGRWERFSVLL